MVGDRYVLRSKLGRGATSVVWRATHDILTRDYALKFLEPQSAALNASSADEVVERFRFEAQVSSRLGMSTEHIVATHDAGLFQGVPYMVMDLVRGESVAVRLRREPMLVPDVARMAHDIADALEACHSNGIAHRDTKPANILSAVDGTFKLVDFGLAKLFGAAPTGVLRPRETTGSMLVGTPAYMSPEAISADKTSSGRGDVWSLAITIFECLTRTLPFQGEGWPAVALAIMQRKFKRPSEHGPDLAPFDAVFERAFAQDAQERFSTPTELARAFAHAAAQRTREEHHEPAPIGDTASPSPWPSRPPAASPTSRATTIHDVTTGVHQVSSAQEPRRYYAASVLVAALLTVSLGIGMSQPLHDVLATKMGNPPSLATVTCRSEPWSFTHGIPTETQASDRTAPTSQSNPASLLTTPSPVEPTPATRKSVRVSPSEIY